jgi:pimeloyl-ACP methyl ester carboxylesterase
MPLHFYQTGPAAAPTLVFLHGGGAPDRFAAQVRDWVNQSTASASDI